MDFFNTFWSDTLAASGNQSWFREDAETVCTGRVYYKLFAGGSHKYSLLFTNIVDSTYSDGSYSHAGLICAPWLLRSASVAICDDVESGEMSFSPLSFDGKPDHSVAPGEFFRCDPIALSPKAGQYLCLEMTFSGTVMPYMEEAIIPVFRKKDGIFVPDKHMPLAAMVGSDRTIEKRIAFWGDSITEGIGTPDNAYLHWNARIADKLGDRYGYWNLGIGFGRCADAAQGGSWLYKAAKADFVNVCFGANDIFQLCDGEKLKKDFLTVIRFLREAGCGVGLFTVPPIDAEGEKLAVWEDVNDYIRTQLRPLVSYVFDVVPVWGQEPPNGHKTRIGNCHPGPEGCEALAEAFVKEKLL